MKKVAAILVVVLLLFSLSGCDNTYHFDYDELKETVQKIEIIDYDALTKEERLLTVISESEQDQFLKDLSQIEFYHAFGDPDTPKGYSIKLIYNNYDYEIITWSGTTKNRFLNCVNKLFEEMLSKYYPN